MKKESKSQHKLAARPEGTKAAGGVGSQKYFRVGAKGSPKMGKAPKAC